MIRRIVKMTFQTGKRAAFLSNYTAARNSILSFEGIHNLEVFTDANDGDTVITISEWDSENALNNYRKSDFFRALWTESKKTFREPAEAWSLTKYQEGQ